MEPREHRAMRFSPVTHTKLLRPSSKAFQFAAFAVTKTRFYTEAFIQCLWSSRERLIKRRRICRY